MKLPPIYLLGILVLSEVSLQETQTSSTNPLCREFSVEGRINGGEQYSHEIGGGLLLRLTPSLAPPNQNWGWVIQVMPQDSNDDYAWPVNPPFHFGNSQWLATGYNETARQQFGHDHEVFFVLSKAEYERATKLAYDALNHTDSEAAGKFLAILPSLRSAVLKLKPLKYETANDGKSVSWLQFSVSVRVPTSFQVASGVSARNVTCPLP